MFAGYLIALHFMLFVALFSYEEGMGSAAVAAGGPITASGADPDVWQKSSLRDEAS
jgi:homeobox protein cut-like